MMEQSLSALIGEDSSLGLNIITDTETSNPSGVTTTILNDGVGDALKITTRGGGGVVPNKKPRKKNKYEKRRAKARQAKDQKQQLVRQQQQQNFVTPNENVGTTTVRMMAHQQSKDTESNNEVDGITTSNTTATSRATIGDSSRYAASKSAAASTAATVVVVATDDQEQEGLTTTTTNATTKTTQPPTIPETTNNNNTTWKNAYDTLLQQKDLLPQRAPTTRPSPPITTNTANITDTNDVNITTTTSRKNQHSETTQILKDDVKRAEYMSTFHARPHEMDRRSGATASSIRQSRESSHLFQTVDRDDEDEDGKRTNGDGGNGDDGNDLTSSNCPFARCGLHPKIVRAITTSKGCGLNLERPTMIQQNAWNEMLIRGGNKITTNGGDGGSSSRKNLFVQSETGSGKTLAYFLPILQSLALDPTTKEPTPIPRLEGGTRAIVLCPTRELAIQSATVISSVCQSTFPWLVAGCLSGGEKRKSEKARLRKGVSVLVATPGRLLDHLDKTDCLKVMLRKGRGSGSACGLEWVVLDESDRLLDMGLGSQVEHILQIIRSNNSNGGDGKKGDDGVTWRSALVSATITEKVEALAKTLMGSNGEWVWARASKQKGRDFLGLKSDDVDDKSQAMVMKGDKGAAKKGEFNLFSATPQQLTQHHMIVSAKLRLPALIAFLVTRVRKRERVVIFMSTCDAVDFHHKLFNGMTSILPQDKHREDMDDRGGTGGAGIFGKLCSLFRLHGSIPHKERHVILSQFSEISTSNPQPSILIATDVAARGLNLPSVDWIVQYDPPCETDDYIHRAGRAARAGRAGHALLFLLPSERQYVEVLNLRGLTDMPAISLSSTLAGAAGVCPDVTALGMEISGHGSSRAGNSGGRVGEGFASAVQIRLEECITEDDVNFKAALAKKISLSSASKSKSKSAGGAIEKKQKRRERKELKNAAGPLLESARKAFHSYIRGYSTKEKAVRHIFSTRALHLGHVARSFALKEVPTALAKVNQQQKGDRDMNDDEGDILKSTGKKRNASLAFGGRRRQHIEGVTDGNDDNEEGVEHTKKPKRGSKQNDLKSNSRTLSFMDQPIDQSLDSTQRSEGGSITKTSSFSNVRAKMHANARKLQDRSIDHM